jgi:NTE family protein
VHAVEASTTALVLGGGGVTGIAWEIGVLRGLRAAGGELAEALAAPALVLGTSAGSVVGTHVAAGSDLDELWEAQRATSSSEIASSVDLEALFASMAERTQDATDDLDARRRVGELAREVDRGASGARRAAVAARLPVHDWPERPLRITAVDAHTGEVVVFDRASGVALDDAVAASCAVPGVWPVVPIAGPDGATREYMDGGMASLTHLPLAAGHERVVVLVPFPTTSALGMRGFDDELAAVRSAGTDVVVVGPDPEYLAGPGRAALDPAGRRASAELGDRLGRSLG